MHSKARDLAGGEYAAADVQHSHGVMFAIALLTLCSGPYILVCARYQCAYAQKTHNHVFPSVRSAVLESTIVLCCSSRVLSRPLFDTFVSCPSLSIALVIASSRYLVFELVSFAVTVTLQSLLCIISRLQPVARLPAEK